MISFKGNKSYISFGKRLIENSMGVLLFYIVLVFFSLILGNKAVLIITAVIGLVKGPVILKRSRYHLLSLQEYENHYRVVYLDVDELKTRLILKEDFKISIELFQSRDSGFYLVIKEGKRLILRATDSCGWTVRDFLEMVKQITGETPKNWYFQEKYLSKYLGEDA